MEISIEYCMQWNYEPKAFSLREELGTKYISQIDDFKMIQSGGGVFKVIQHNNDGSEIVLFDKKEKARFPHPDEIEINL